MPARVIGYASAGGRVADFDALMYTLITNSARVDQPEATQDPSRRGSIMPARTRYSHPPQEDSGAALNRLPQSDAPVSLKQQGTGPAAGGRMIALTLYLARIRALACKVIQCYALL